jgi:hypothetical protein
MYHGNDHQSHHYNTDSTPRPQTPGEVAAGLDRWASEQLFEEDVRAALKMMRPHGRERMMGWKEYRTGGAHFRVTVSWDDEFEITDPQAPLTVPNMTDVIEALLVGSASNQDLMQPDEEFTRYRQVLCQVHERLHDRQSSFE